MIYLDNSATTAPFKEAADAVLAAFQEDFFNPSAAYAPAVRLHTRIEQGRARMLKTLNVENGSLLFTSGGTESNNFAIYGALSAMRGRGRVVTTAVEHPSVSAVFRSLMDEGYDVVKLPVNAQGALEPETLDTALTRDTRLVSFMQVNNEVGAVNDIGVLAALVKARCPKAVVHCDGVQAYGRLTPDLSACPVDLYSISGHKFHGPKGVGALYIRKGVRMAPMLVGGGQEDGLRSGTTNAPAILGMLEAARICLQDNDAILRQLRACKLRLAEALLDIEGARVNGPPPEEGAPHIFNVSFEGVRGETLMHSLERHEIYVSTGSACSARAKKESRVLEAMGITGERALGAVRISLGALNTPEEMDAAADAFKHEVEQLRKYRRT